MNERTWANLSGFMKSDFPVETVDVSVLAQVSAMSALRFPFFLFFFKLVPLKVQLSNQLFFCNALTIN